MRLRLDRHSLICAVVGLLALAPGTVAAAPLLLNVLLGGTDPFTLVTTDILLNVSQTAVGDPLVSGYNTITVDVGALLAANAGSTLRLRRRTRRR